MDCYLCDNEASQRCPRCGNPYCGDHGEDLCADCLNPVNAAPSGAFFRASLLALLLGSVLALWLLVRPPGLPSDSSGVVIPEASPQPVTPTPAASPLPATPAAAPTPQPTPPPPPPRRRPPRRPDAHAARRPHHHCRADGGAARAHRVHRGGRRHLVRYRGGVRRGRGISRRRQRPDPGRLPPAGAAAHHPAVAR